jgi:hypothetical protein
MRISILVQIKTDQSHPNPRIEAIFLGFAATNVHPGHSFQAH